MSPLAVIAPAPAGYILLSIMDLLPHGRQAGGKITSITKPSVAAPYFRSIQQSGAQGIHLVGRSVISQHHHINCQQTHQDNHWQFHADKPPGYFRTPYPRRPAKSQPPKGHPSRKPSAEQTHIPSPRHQPLLNEIKAAVRSGSSPE